MSSALERVARMLGRHVNPTVYTATEFAKRAWAENAFLTKVLEQPKLWVIGTEHDLPDRGLSASQLMAVLRARRNDEHVVGAGLSNR